MNTRKRVAMEEASKVTGAWQTFPAPLAFPPPLKPPTDADVHRAWLQEIVDNVNRRLATAGLAPRTPRSTR